MELFLNGDGLRRLGRFEEALACYQSAIALSPPFAEARCHCANVHLLLGRFDEAIRAYDEAITARADYVHAHANRGVALQSLARHDEALASYNTALSFKDDYAGARFNRGLLRLTLGELPDAWADFEWRYEDSNSTASRERRAFPKPRWCGEPLVGRSILVYCEQGYGDGLQFVRYVRCLAARGARVILEAHRPLIQLFADIPGVTQLVVRGNPLPAFDYHCPLMSLPSVFGTTLNDVPFAEGYLASDPGKVGEWRARLGEKRMRRVGVAWSGNPIHANDRRRSIALEALEPFLPEGIEYVALQTEVRHQDQAALGGGRFRDFGSELQDFSDTAALCECLDLIVSVDTSVAHLSGSLARPTWILLPNPADWRWLLTRRDSPWYRSMRLFRQGEDRGWLPVFKALREALELWREAPQ
ncbi:MAG TPA: tetratricopeptide repeat-containing glycosyltransferase family protein [Steroidobacteraceae bacterium]|jgi:hypothetical protein